MLYERCRANEGERERDEKIKTNSGGTRYAKGVCARRGHGGRMNVEGIVDGDGGGGALLMLAPRDI